jgi:hypothetical protein
MSPITMKKASPAVISVRQPAKVVRTVCLLEAAVVPLPSRSSGFDTFGGFLPMLGLGRFEVGASRWATAIAGHDR